MDSSGIGMLVSHYVRCRGKGVRLIAAGADPRIVQLFKLTRVDSFIPMVDTLAEAEQIKQSATAFAGYFEIVPTRLRSIATSLSAFQNRKLGFLSPHWT